MWLQHRSSIVTPFTAGFSTSSHERVAHPVRPFAILVPVPCVFSKLTSLRKIFTPMGAHIIFVVSLRKLFDKTVEKPDLSVDRATQTICDGPGSADRPDQLNAILTETQPPVLRIVNKVVRMYRPSGGGTRVADKKGLQFSIQSGQASV
jgi:hypothetical protein